MCVCVCRDRERVCGEIEESVKIKRGRDSVSRIIEMYL